MYWEIYFESIISSCSLPGICHCGEKTWSKKKRQSLAKYFKAKEFIFTVQTQGFSQKNMFLFSLHGINETSLKRQKKYLAHLTLVKGLLIMWTTSKGKSSKMKRAFYLFLHFSVSLPRMNVEMNVNILQRMRVIKYFISSFPVFLSWGPSIVNSAVSGQFI